MKIHFTHWLCAILFLQAAGFLGMSGAQARPPLIVGVCAHLSLYHSDNFKPKALADLDALAQMGARVVRWDAQWSRVEASAGTLQLPPMWDFIVDEGNRRGIANVMILDYGNKLYNGGRRPLSDEDISKFLRYAELVVDHFRDRVPYFEIWNEWDEGNGGAGAGTPEEYVRFVSKVYPVLKAIAPNAIFLVGGASRNALGSLQQELLGLDKTSQHFFETALALGLLRYGDGLSVHPYSRWGLSVESKLTQYRDLMRLIANKTRAANKGKPFPLYVTELGWSTSKLPPIQSVSREDQAALLTGAIQSTVRELPDVKMVTIYQLADMARNKPFSVPENYGLVEGFGGNEAKKPSYQALQTLLHGMGGATAH